MHDVSVPSTGAISCKAKVQHHLKDQVYSSFCELTASKTKLSVYHKLGKSGTILFSFTFCLVFERFIKLCSCFLSVPLVSVTSLRSNLHGCPLLAVRMPLQLWPSCHKRCKSTNVFLRFLLILWSGNSTMTYWEISSLGRSFPCAHKSSVFSCCLLSAWLLNQRVYCLRSLGMETFHKLPSFAPYFAIKKETHFSSLRNFCWAVQRSSLLSLRTVAVSWSR